MEKEYEICEKEKKNACVTESLHCTPETNTAL